MVGAGVMAAVREGAAGCVVATGVNVAGAPASQDECQDEENRQTFIHR